MAGALLGGAEVAWSSVGLIVLARVFAGAEEGGGGIVLCVL